jgi:hypothetical protein
MRPNIAGKWQLNCISFGREITILKHFLLLGGLFMAASITAPVALMADDHHGEKRYYDRDHHDYHYWNDDEDHRYRVYLQEQHRDYVPFVKVEPRVRKDYFKYRHDHGLEVEIKK